MSDRQPARRATSREHGTVGPSGALRSIAAPASAFVSPPAIRRAIAGYAAEQGWAPSMTAGAMREGMALALAAAGMIVQMPDAAGAEPWTRTVPTTYDVLQALTGLDRSGVRSTLEVLASAGVARSAQDDGGLTLALSAEALWAPHPLLVAVPWPLLSLGLTRANAPLRAALVVFAELALDTEVGWRAQHPMGDLAAAPPNVWLELTLRELSNRAGYHLSHVENALAGLDAAECLTRLRGRGTSGRALRLAPWTLGAASPPAALTAATPVESRPESVATAPQPEAGDGIVVEFQGVRAVLAAGDTLDVSGRDPDGRRVLRIRTDDGDIIIRPSRQRPPSA